MMVVKGAGFSSRPARGGGSADPEEEPDMNAKEHLDRGELTAAIQALNEEVRAKPADLHLRTFLFELHCYAGDFARAEKQLDVIRNQGSGIEWQNGVSVYQDLLDAEKSRARLFAEAGRPRFVFAPPGEVLAHLEALELIRSNRQDEARAVLERAAAAAPPVRGTAGEAPFEGFRDADDVLAPVLEVYTATGYYWIPWVHIQYLEVPPPRNLRDLLWSPAKLATFDGQVGEVFLPSLYPFSSSHPDQQVRLGRMTDWVEVGAGLVRGVGRKTLLVGDDARSVLELDEVRFEPSGDVNQVPPSETPGEPGDQA
jgi:type VI secretion system protein ImpE